MSVRPRTFTYEVSLDRSGTATSSRGGAPIPSDDENWTPEHLLLTALCRCTLTSLRYHARRAGLALEASAAADGVVAWRAADERFAFAEIRVRIDVELPAAPEEAVRALVMKAERDCFVGASLALKPNDHWTVNGEDLS
jgi:organic hydroperoxide reductase OsmC/OhrA